MKRASVLSAVLTMVLAFLGALATAASALQWLLNARPITSKVSVRSSFGDLTFADLQFLGESMALKCEGNDEGTVGPTGHDEVTGLELSFCRYVENAEGREERGACESLEKSSPLFAPLNLPWLSSLLNVSGITRDRITAKNGGGIGWDIECEVGGRGIPDECTSVARDPEVVNLSSLGVDVDFSGAETWACTQGTATSGMLVGTDLIEAPVGHKLSVSAPPVACEVKKAKWVFCSGGDEASTQVIEGGIGAVALESTVGGLELEVTCKKGKYVPTLEFAGEMSGGLTLEECAIIKPAGTCKVKSEQITAEAVLGYLEGALAGPPEVKLEGASKWGKLVVEGCEALAGTYILAGVQKCTVDTNYKKEEAEHEFKCAEAGSSLKLEKEGSGKDEATKLAMTIKGPLKAGGKWSMELN